MHLVETEKREVRVQGKTIEVPPGIDLAQAQVFAKRINDGPTTEPFVPKRNEQ